MFKRWMIASILSCWSLALYAESYIIIFKDQKLELIGKEAHKQSMESRKLSNKNRIEQLFNAMGVTRSGVVHDDLWLVSSMQLQLKPEELPMVKNLPFVQSVVLNKFRKYIQPAEETPQVLPAKDWGLERLAIRKIREENPEADGAGIRVGVIDTGIQSRHPEFEKKNTVVFKDFVNGLRSPYDDNGHGTHVAGTIAGATTGVAPQVELFVAKAFTAGGGADDATLLKAMQWLYDPDGNPETDDYPHLISNSWGSDLPFEVVDIAEFEMFHRATKAWVESDIVPVFAAGNSGIAPNGMPAGFPEVFAIAAFDVNDKVADFSSRGPNFWKDGKESFQIFKPDFAAPGVDIYSAWPGNSYQFLSGTSMATPFASGSIALILQKAGRIPVSQLKNLLLVSMEAKFDFGFGAGILSPREALIQLGVGGPEGMPQPEFAPLAQRQRRAFERAL